MENYYKLLGIMSSATEEEIKRALRRAAERQELELDEIRWCREYFESGGKSGIR